MAESVGTPTDNAARRARRPRGAAGRPVGARRPGARPRARPALRRARPARRRRSASRRRCAATSRRPARWPPRTPSMAAEADAAREQRSRVLDAPHPRPARARATRPTPRTSSSRSRRGEGGDESRAVRRRPGAHVHALRRAARLEDRGRQRHRGRARRLQGHQLAVKSRDPADPVYGRLKYEGGVHRVQRVPVTESQGRIHTSAAGVLVLPEAEDVDVHDRPERPAHRRLPLSAARAGRASTRPTPPCASPTCRPASRCRMQNEK